MPDHGTADVTCWLCGELLEIPILDVDDHNVIHLDHRYLRQHADTHDTETHDVQQ
jgi:hypothetical protein